MKLSVLIMFLVLNQNGLNCQVNKPPPIVSSTQKDVDTIFLTHIKASIELEEKATDLIKFIDRDSINPINLGNLQEVITILITTNKHLEEANKLIKKVTPRLNNLPDKLRHFKNISDDLFKESEAVMSSAVSSCSMLNKEAGGILQVMRGHLVLVALLRRCADLRLESLKYSTKVLVNTRPDVEIPDIDPFMV